MPKPLIQQCKEAVEAVNAVVPNATTEIVGVWCWAWGGDIGNYEAFLRSCNWKYVTSKDKWCWHPPQVKWQGYRQTYEEIQATYGVHLHLEGGANVGNEEPSGRNSR